MTLIAYSTMPITRQPKLTNTGSRNSSSAAAVTDTSAANATPTAASITAASIGDHRLFGHRHC